jgi:hypothetical protein
MAAESNGKQYEVKLPFRPVGYMRLPVPLDLPHSIHIEESDNDYVATITLTSTSALEALSQSITLLDDLLGLFAIADGRFLILREDSRRNVRRPNAEYVAEGPPPPFEVIGGYITQYGAELTDPTGELRRSGKIVNLFVSPIVTHNNVEFETAALLNRDKWSSRLARAVSLFHLAQCATDISVSFVLSYTTLEVLSDDNTAGLFKAIIPDSEQRRLVLEQISDILSKTGCHDEQVERFLRQIQNTRQNSQLDAFAQYFTSQNIPTSLLDLKWYREQRSRFVHEGGFDISDEAKKRMEAFKAAIRQALRQEISRVET